MKIGKNAAFLVGAGIILVEVANEQGWIRIDCEIGKNLKIEKYFNRLCL